ncbi:MAG: hypothetical protein AAFO04_21215 [Cyanobacteria bacterium J06592_8]
MAINWYGTSGNDTYDYLTSQDITATANGGDVTLKQIEFSKLKRRSHFLEHLF